MADLSDEPKAKRVKLENERENTQDVDYDDDDDADDGESTEYKLAVLASMFPDKSQDVLLDYVLAYGGSVARAIQGINGGLQNTKRKRRQPVALGYQSSIASFTGGGKKEDGASPTVAIGTLTKKGKTLHLYSPKDVETHTPCSIIHNFLPNEDADALLRELLDESSRFNRNAFQMFERTVTSGHTWRLYVDTEDEVERQQKGYAYDGSDAALNVQQTTPELLKASSFVKDAVNREVARRTQDYQPDGKKLKFQSPDAWEPNAALVNCYNGPKEGMGFHTDTLTNIGPRPIIGSLSLGVARQFRVRRIVSKDDERFADEQGQIAIHLPHNSLLVMHAEMQEEWKHCILPTTTIDPHPIAGGRRLNVTYRYLKDFMEPQYTPRCKCGVSCVLRCVMKSSATRGRYMWQCFADRSPGGKSCGHFVWAEFDEDGRPSWAEGYKGNFNVPSATGTTAKSKD